MKRDIKATRLKDMNKLRGRLDGNDMFMSAHQIKKVRTRERIIPPWTLSDTEVQKVLLRAFPNWRKNKTQLRRAGRWVRFIHLYYRMQLSQSQVASELGISVGYVGRIGVIMNRVFKGLRANDGDPRGLRPRGRPKTK